MNKDLVQGRLDQMSQFLAELEPLLKRETNEIMYDNIVLRAIERLFQLPVDSAVSINNHIVAQGGFAPAEDYQSTFTTLAQHNVIPTEFAVKIAPSVGLRNQLIHRYGDVNISSMVDQIKGEIGDYVEYIKHLDEFLKKQDS